MPTARARHPGPQPLDLFEPPDEGNPVIGRTPASEILRIPTALAAPPGTGIAFLASH